MSLNYLLDYDKLFFNVISKVNIYIDKR